jgi:hypothetical protein
MHELFYHKFHFRLLFTRISKIKHTTLTMKVVPTRNTMNMSRTTNQSSSLYTICWVSVILSLATDVSAFNSVKRRLAAVIVRSPPGTSLHDSSTESYRRPNVSTCLQYRDGNEDSLHTIDKWWSNLFQPAAEVDEDEQVVVDQYLEFLDRRYKRLKKKEDKPFSAMDWLLQGSPNRNEPLTLEQQKEDALYVLGVAGLASQRLLQKHHLEHMKQEPSFAPVQFDTSAAVDVTVTPEPSKLTVIAIKALRSVLKVLYIVQYRRQLVLGNAAQKLSAFGKAMIKSFAKTLVQGPVDAAKWFLEIGGGKKTMLMTFTVVSAVVLLLDPIVKASLREGSTRL